MHTNLTEPNHSIKRCIHRAARSFQDNLALLLIFPSQNVLKRKGSHAEVGKSEKRRKRHKNQQHHHEHHDREQIPDKAHDAIYESAVRLPHNVVNRVQHRRCTTLTVNQIGLTHIAVEQIHRGNALLGSNKPQTPALNNQRQYTLDDKGEHQCDTKNHDKLRAVGVAEKFRDSSQISSNRGTHRQVNDR